MHTDLNTTAESYKGTIIKGWDNLYQEKRSRLNKLLSTFFVGRNALEMGCGDGESTKSIIQYFENLDVIDGSEQQLIDVKKAFPEINTIHSYFENFKSDKKYDTIFMTHILEHLDDPKLILDNAFNNLSKEGVVLIAVPNAQSFHRQIGVKMGLLKTPYDLNEQDILLGHRRVFDHQSMTALIKQTQFKIKNFTGLMIKPISNRQIEGNWSPELIDAFFQLGFDYPEYCSEIIYILEK